MSGSRAEGMGILVDKVRLQVGESVLLRLPWSEVCMHLGMAGKAGIVRVTESGAQLLDSSGREVSFPITHGEAGIYSDVDGFYVLADAVMG